MLAESSGRLRDVTVDNNKSILVVVVVVLNKSSTTTSHCWAVGAGAQPKQTLTYVLMLFP